MQVGKVYSQYEILSRRGMYFLGILLLLFCVSGCTSAFNNDKLCEWCETSGTKEVEKELGGKCYVCEECYSHCIYCEKTATMHYSSETGLEVFVCDDCYQIDMEMMIENGIREKTEK